MGMKSEEFESRGFEKKILKKTVLFSFLFIFI